MPMPILGPFAQSLYDELKPLAWDDKNQGYALAHLINGLSQVMEDVEALIRDSEDGPGWSIIVDVDRCPDEWLPWLAQWLGVRLDLSLSANEQRQQIRDHEAWRRGTVPVMKRVVQRNLVGLKRVQVRERGGSAYHFTVATWGADTVLDRIDYDNFPDMYPTYLAVYNGFQHYSEIYNAFGPSSADRVLTEIMRQKPGGLSVNYVILFNQDYYILWEKSESYLRIYNSYATYQQIYDDAPVYTFPVLTWESIYAEEASYGTLYVGQQTYQQLFERYLLY